MRHLLFVRHSLPEIEEHLDRVYWRLSAEGKRRAERIADRIATYDVKTIVASNEIKAIETGNAIAGRTGQPFGIDERLREHGISNEPYLAEPAFKRLVHSFFEQPETTVFGEESAESALRRFTDAVSEIRKKHRSGDIVLVSHGRVLSLFLAEHLQEEPFELWKRLKAPSVVVLRHPGLELEEAVYSVEDL